MKLSATSGGGMGRGEVFIGGGCGWFLFGGVTGKGGLEGEPREL